MSTQRPPARDHAYAVFSQRLGERLDLASWQTHGERFFGVSLGIVGGAKLEAESPWVHAVHLTVAPKGEKALEGGGWGARACFCRPTVEADVEAAALGESRTGRAGLVDLARRCPSIWLIEARADGGARGDVAALRIAAILAATELGPILAPGATALFGPKGARERLGR